MNIIQEDQNPQLKTLNEMFVNVSNSLPNNIEQSIYYAKLRQLLHSEIYNFCKEQIEMREDLNFLRMNVGKQMEEQEIRDYLDELKNKYNSHYHNLGIEYHIEVTRYDYGVPVFCIIKRNEIFVKKFVFRFKKETANTSIDGLSISGIPNGGEK